MNNGKITKTNNNSKKSSSKHLMTGTAIFIAAILVISGTNIKAFADQILVANEVDVDIQQATVTAGSSVNVKYYIRATGGNPPSCDAADGTAATLSLSTLFNPQPSSFNLNNCGTAAGQTVTFTVPSNTAPNSYTINAPSVVDSSGQYAAGPAQFTIVVQAPPAPPSDTTPPVISNIPLDITGVEATSSAGAVVTYTSPTAFDAGDNAAVTVICSPASGSTFPITTTTVNCEAKDSVGNKATASFTVTVQDTTPPTIQNVPTDMVVGAQNSGGATVTYNNPTATDLVDPSVDVTCDPASGQNLPIGINTVTCTASDDSQNLAQATFKVTVNIPSVQYPLPPVNPDGSSTYKKGSTIPFKLGAQYAGGEQASDLAISLALLKVGPAQNEPVNEIVSTSAATTGSLFRWDSTSQQFIYNLATKTLEAGVYKAYATVNGFGIVQSVEFNLRK